MVQRALQKSEALGSLNHSITGGAGNFAGYMGEECISHFLGADNVSCDEGDDKFNYDLIYNGYTIEVKTKRRTVDPKDFYDVSIAKTSTHQKPDVYAFVSITKNRGKVGFNNVWLCGFMGCKEFFDSAVFHKKGSIDHQNNFKVHRDMYNMRISDLYIDLEDIL